MAEQMGQAPGIATDEIDLSKLLGSIRRGWLLIAVCVVVSSVMGLIYLHSATYRYSVALQVTPTSGGGQSSGLGKLGGLANVAGISLPSNQNEILFDLYLQGLTSHAVAYTLASEPEIMRKAFKSEWSEKEQRWVQPRGFMESAKNVVWAILGVPSREWSPPDAVRLQRYLAKHIRIEKDKESPIVTIALVAADPKFGELLLKAAHEEADTMLRERSMVRASIYIDHLSRQLAKVDVADYRQALLEVLAEQEKTRMMASSSLPFVAEPFNEPKASREPVSPNPVLTMVLALMGGTVIGLVVTLFRS